MDSIGLIKAPNYGKQYVDYLDAEAQKKQAPRILQAMEDFVSQGYITRQQADAAAVYIGAEGADLHNPFGQAVKDGVLTQEQGQHMSMSIMQASHGDHPCTGTATWLFDSGETLLEGKDLSTDKRDDSIIKATNGAVVRIKNCTLTKKGDTTDHSEGSFTGLNAGVLAEGGTIYIEDSSLVADAYGGNNLFAHGKGSKIVLKNVLLDAYGKAANRCIYCAFGGTVEAENCELTSRGVISSTVATDTGQGTIRLKNCLIKTLGSGCASLYSTGHIYAENCICVAPETEGLIIVGRDYMELTDTHVFSGSGQGCKLAGSPGDPEEYSEFIMTGGSLTAIEGAAVYSAGNGRITLRNVKVANPSGIAFAADYSGPNVDKMMRPGETPQNCHVGITIVEQYIEGISSGSPAHGITLSITQGSRYKGALNPANDALYCNLHLDASSVLELTGDSYVHKLVNDDTTGENIIKNGFTLTVLDK